MCKYLLVFHCNYVSIWYCFWDSQHQIMVWLEIWVSGHSRSLETAPFDRLHTSSYWHSIETMALSCIISEIKWDIGRKSQFFSYPLHSMPPVWGPVEILSRFRAEKLESCGYPTVKMCEDMTTRFDRIHECDRRTGGRTDGHCMTAKAVLMDRIMQ